MHLLSIYAKLSSHLPAVQKRKSGCIHAKNYGYTSKIENSSSYQELVSHAMSKQGQKHEQPCGVGHTPAAQFFATIFKIQDQLLCRRCMLFSSKKNLQ